MYSYIQLCKIQNPFHAVFKRVVTDGTGSPGHGSPGQRFWPGRVGSRVKNPDPVPSRRAVILPCEIFCVFLTRIDRCSGFASLCVVVCSIQQGNMVIEGELTNGLIVGHAYSVTDAKTVRYLSALKMSIEKKHTRTKQQQLRLLVREYGLAERVKWRRLV